MKNTTNAEIVNNTKGISKKNSRAHKKKIAIEVNYLRNF